MSLIFWKLIFDFPLKFSIKFIRVPFLYQLPFKHSVKKKIFLRYSNENNYFISLLSILFKMSLIF